MPPTSSLPLCSIQSREGKKKTRLMGNPLNLESRKIGKNSKLLLPLAISSLMLAKEMAKKRKIMTRGRSRVSLVKRGMTQFISQSSK